jgi:hypothetical protein
VSHSSLQHYRRRRPAAIPRVDLLVRTRYPHPEYEVPPRHQSPRLNSSPHHRGLPSRHRTWPNSSSLVAARCNSRTCRWRSGFSRRPWPPVARSTAPPHCRPRPRHNTYTQDANLVNQGVDYAASRLGARTDVPSPSPVAPAAAGSVPRVPHRHGDAKISQASLPVEDHTLCRRLRTEGTARRSGAGTT